MHYIIRSDLQKIGCKSTINNLFVQIIFFYLRISKIFSIFAPDFEKNSDKFFNKTLA